MAIAKHIGVVSLSVGAILLATGFMLVRWKNWSPVNVALPLKAGNHIEVPFRAEISSRHNIYLRVEQGEDWRHTQCLLGTEADPRMCKDGTSVVNVSWTVFSQGNLIARGDSSEWLGTSGVAGRLIGIFEARRGAQYTFSISVNGDGTALNALHPEVTVDVDNRILEQNIIEAAVLQWVGGISVVLGLIVLSCAIWVTPARKTA